MRWPARGDQYLRNNWPTDKSVAEIGRILGVSPSSVVVHAASLGLPSRQMHDIEPERATRSARLSSTALLEALRSHHRVEDVVNAR